MQLYACSRAYVLVCDALGHARSLPTELISDVMDYFLVGNDDHLQSNQPSNQAVGQPLPCSSCIMQHTGQCVTCMQHTGQRVPGPVVPDV